MAKVPTPPDPPMISMRLFILVAIVVLYANPPVIHNADHAVNPAYKILAASI